MVTTTLEPGHFFIGDPNGGSVEVIVRDNRAYLYDLLGDTNVDLFRLLTEIEKLVHGQGVTEVFLHTSPGSERLEEIYEKRYGFKRLWMVWVREIDMGGVN